MVLVLIYSVMSGGAWPDGCEKGYDGMLFFFDIGKLGLKFVVFAFLVFVRLLFAIYFLKYILAMLKR